MEMNNGYRLGYLCGYLRKQAVSLDWPPASKAGGKRIPDNIPWPPKGSGTSKTIPAIPTRAVRAPAPRPAPIPANPAANAQAQASFNASQARQPSAFNVQQQRQAVFNIGQVPGNVAPGATGGMVPGAPGSYGSYVAIPAQQVAPTRAAPAPAATTPAPAPVPAPAATAPVPAAASVAPGANYGFTSGSYDPSYYESVVGGIYQGDQANRANYEKDREIFKRLTPAQKQEMAKQWNVDVGMGVTRAPVAPSMEEQLVRARENEEANRRYSTQQGVAPRSTLTRGGRTL